MLFKNKKKAAAIKYFKDNLNTPVITALGNDDFAEKIIEEARQNGINIIENSDFFKFENLFKIDREIPVEVYKIVANILVNIFKTNEAAKNEKKDIFR